MKKQSGITLMEVLVSTIILALLLLSFNALQVAALHEAKYIYYYNVATQQLNNIIERLIALKALSYAEQCLVWNQQNQKLLPNGFGQINGEYPNFKISVLWGGLMSCEKISIGQKGCVVITVDL